MHCFFFGGGGRALDLGAFFFFPPCVGLSIAVAGFLFFVCVFFYWGGWFMSSGS